MQANDEIASERYVAHFSCGTASACATKLAIEKHGDLVHVINAFIADELDDNRRFLADCERWLGRSIVVMRDEKYGASAAAVWRKRRFIAGKDGAPCSGALKRDVLKKYHRPGDTIVLGYTADPSDADRYERLVDANAEMRTWAPLIEAGITKRDCYAMIRDAGIELPLMNRMGYHNANCPKCPKGGMGYWNRIRVDFPENFEEMASLQDVLGPSSYFLSDRRGGTRVRVSLRMLDPNAGRFEDETPFECGAFCEMQTAFNFGDAA